MLLVLCACNDPEIPAEEAHKHVGRVRTVCGRVESSTYRSDIQGRPTFLNLGRPYPDHALSIVIWGRHRNDFTPPPEEQFLMKRVCITGEIRLHKGRPDIEATDPTMIRIE